jgi:5-methylcytosine-specific restriction endonuclease McrA
MAEVKPKTVGQSLYWSYANLVMAWVSILRRDPSYEKLHYMIRNRNYSGFMKGTIKIGSFFKDEQRKPILSDYCSYCGSQDDLTLDHMIPRLKSGPHSADNLVRACRSCNSSKQARDLLDWMAAKREFPSLTVLSRYLKIAIAHCVQHDVMYTPLEYALSLDPPLPFAITLVPHRFPDPDYLVVAFVSSDEEEVEEGDEKEEE